MGDICFQKGIAYNTPCTVPKVGPGPISHKGKYDESPSYLFELILIHPIGNMSTDFLNFKRAHPLRTKLHFHMNRIIGKSSKSPRLEDSSNFKVNLCLACFSAFR